MGIVAGDGGDPVQTVEQGLAEVHIVGSGLPLIMAQGQIVDGLFLVGGHKVDQIEIAVGAGTVGPDQIRLGGIVQPFIHLRGGDIGVGDFAAEQRLGSQRVGLGVVAVFNAEHMDILDIPILLVALVDVVGVLLPFGAEEGAAVQEGLVAGAELFAHLFQILGVGGIAPVIGQTGQEVGAGLGELDLQLIIADGLDADGVEVGLGDAGHAVFKLLHLIKIGFRADEVEDQVGGAGAVGGIQDPLGGGDPVFRADIRAILGTVVIQPLDAFPDLEDPALALAGLAVFFIFEGFAGPAFGQTGLAHAVVVIFHQAVDVVGPGVAGGGVQRVPVGNFVGIEELNDLFFVVALAGFLVVFVAIVAAAGQTGHQHHSSQKQCDQLLHVLLSPYFVS